MQPRLNLVALLGPEAISTMQALGKLTENGSVPARTLRLVHLRASQINGCSVAGTGANLTTYQYNLDKQPTLVTRPDGQTISFNYDTGGRLSTIATPASMGEILASSMGGRVS